MTHVILLAAGSSRRFGADKLLAPWRGRLLYRYGLHTLAAVCAARADAALLVVTNTPAIAQAAAACGARAVPSPHSAQGQSASIRAGLDAAGPLGTNDFLLFAVADQPLLRAATVHRLLDLAVPGTWGATAACGGRVGSPALFCAALAPQLYALGGDCGGRAVLNARPQAVLRVACEAEELWDIDRPGDGTPPAG